MAAATTATAKPEPTASQSDVMATVAAADSGRRQQTLEHRQEVIKKSRKFKEFKALLIFFISYILLAVLFLLAAIYFWDRSFYAAQVSIIMTIWFMMGVATVAYLIKREFPQVPGVWWILSVAAVTVLVKREIPKVPKPADDKLGAIR